MNTNSVIINHRHLTKPIQSPFKRNNDSNRISVAPYDRNAHKMWKLRPYGAVEIRLLLQQHIATEAYQAG